MFDEVDVNADLIYEMITLYEAQPNQDLKYIKHYIPDFEKTKQLEDFSNEHFKGFPLVLVCSRAFEGSVYLYDSPRDGWKRRAITSGYA